MPAARSEEFNAAVAKVDAFTSKPTDDELLKLYGHFKQGTQDPPIEESAAPGTFDFKGKAKRRAWQSVVDEGLTPEEAQKKYVEIVEELAKKYS